MSQSQELQAAKESQGLPPAKETQVNRQLNLLLHAIEGLASSWVSLKGRLEGVLSPPEDCAKETDNVKSGPSLVPLAFQIRDLAEKVKSVDIFNILQRLEL